MYKILNGLSPDIMQDIFETKSNCYNTEILKKLDMDYRPSLTWAPKIWNLVPKEMKQIPTLNEFKAKIKIWKLENCPCRLCRTYLPQKGFIT